jgi:MerR HTH family regulatory protein
MDEQIRIRVESLCRFYEVKPAFIYTLQESGLVDVIRSENDEFIPVGDLQKLEKFMRLHRDLGMDAGAIEAIEYLLQKISEMQKEIRALRNRLKIYE